MALITETGTQQISAVAQSDVTNIVVPDAAMLFTGDYSRSGHDLFLTGPDGAKLVLEGYFDTGIPASLVSPQGAMLTGDVVTSLAGPQFPGQYAQAGGAPAGKEPIGTVQSVQGGASVIRANGVTEILEEGSVVFQGDVVITGPGGKLGIGFIDGTVFSISSNARMVLNSLIYNPDGSDNSMLFSLVEGVFVFAAGQIAPTGEMKIQTPVAVIGVRGTTPIVEIDSVLGTVNFSIVPDPGTDKVGTYQIFSLDTGLEIGTVSSVGTRWEVKGDGQTAEFEKTEAELQNDISAISEINAVFTQWQSSTKDVPEAGPDKDGNTKDDTGGETDASTGDEKKSDIGAPNTNTEAQLAAEAEAAIAAAEAAAAIAADAAAAATKAAAAIASAAAVAADAANQTVTETITTSPPPPPPPPPLPPPVTTNEAPAIILPASPTVVEDSANNVISGVSISDVEDDDQTVTLIATSTVSLAPTAIAALNFTTGDGTDDEIMTFSGTVAQINAALAGLTYTPTVNDDDGGSILVITNDGTSATVSTLIINNNPINDAPAIIGDLGISVSEGGSVTVTTADLTENDPDDSGTGLTYTVTGGPSNGQLELTTNAGVAITSFTQDDLDNARVVYIHDGSGTVSDSYDVSLADGGEDGATPAAATVNITITPVNDAPVLTGDLAASVNEGGSVIIGAADLGFTDPDDVAAGITFSVSAPSNGTVQVNGVDALSFTGTQLAAGQVSFLHDGSETLGASFNVSVEDGNEDGSAPVAQAFNLTVAPVNDAPVIIGDLGISVSEGGSVTVTTADLTENDPDDSGTGLTYTVTGGPSNGQLELTTNAGVAITSFTQDDLDNARVVYIHDGSGTVSDSYDVSLADGGEDGATPAAATVNITITPVNDPPVLTGDLAASVNEGGSVIIGAADLGFTDPDDVAAGITFSVSAPSNGTVQVNGVDALSFTGTQLAAGQVSFLHDGSETLGASFNVSVEDGNEDGSAPVAQAFNLTVAPVNDAPVIAGDLAASVNEGGSVIIGAADLGFTDPDDVAAGITFSVSAPSNGTVQVNGVDALSFTGTQLAAGQVSFLHDGSETLGASFNVSVEDGNEDGSAPVAQAFNLTVAPVNDAPVALPDTARATAITVPSVIDDIDAIIVNDNHASALGTNATQILTNDGSGGLTASVLVSTPDARSSDVKIADFDGDGDLDAIIAVFGGGNQLLINQGGAQAGTEGTFVSSALPGGTLNSLGLAVGDVDGDGDLDVIIAEWNNPASSFDNTLLINDGSGVFTASELDGSGIQSRDVAFADVDGDGDLDAIVANDFSGPNRLLINQGGTQGGTEGVFAATNADALNSLTVDVVFGDIDGDGDQDALIANATGQNQILTNQGGAQLGTEGTFAASALAGGNMQSTAIALGDLDGDGDLDAIVTNLAGEANQVLINQGGDQGGTEGAFQAFDIAGSNGASSDVALVDIDGDGDLDAVITNNGFSTAAEGNQLLINDGAGNFMVLPLDGGSNASNAIAFGDLDGDGAVAAADANGLPNINLSPVTGTVAANDSDVDAGAVLTFTLDAPVAGLTLLADGSFVFDPTDPAYAALTEGQVQNVVASYTVTDENSATAQSTLTITVTGTNDAPVAVADTDSITEAAVIDIVSGNVLTNDTDVDNAVPGDLSVTQFEDQLGNQGTFGVELAGEFGFLTLNADGSYIYRLDNNNLMVLMLAAGMIALVDVFDVTISDGALADTSTLTISIDGVGLTLTGDAGPNELTGGADNDFIDGQGGDDVLIGLAGDDFILGGAGDDVIQSGAGDDTADGGAGEDFILGGAGNDNIHGGDNDDFIHGGAGDDVLSGDDGIGDDIVVGGTGNDTIDGGPGSDILLGNQGNDILTGGTGIDLLRGNEGNDRLFGGEGTDLLISGIGFDRMNGGAGDDILIGRNTFVDRTTDLDIAVYDDATAGVSVTLTGPLDSFTSTVTSLVGPDTANIGTDTLINIDKVIGSAFNDIIVVDSTFQGMYGAFTGGLGGGGNKFNEIVGGGGDDTITGNGFTRISFEDADGGVTVDIGAGTASGAGVGSDNFTGVNDVRGSDFGDTLTGSNFAGGDSFRGQAGDDIIDGLGGGDDRADYRNSPNGILADLSPGDVGSGTVQDGFGGTDTLINIEDIRGSEHDDMITGDAGANQLRGKDGNDIIHGGGGVDDLRGEDGNDMLFGGAGDDTLRAGNGFDHLFGGAGADQLIGGPDRDLNTDYDYADYSNVSLGGGGIIVNLTGAFGTSLSTVTGGAEVGSDTLTNIDVVVGTDSADTFTVHDGTVQSAFTTKFGTFNEIEGRGGNDIINGNGATRASYRNADAAVTVDLQVGTAFSTVGTLANVGTDTLSGINNLRGSDFNDTLTGRDESTLGANDAGDSIRGQAGDDAIDGGAGGGDQADYRNSPNGILADLSADAIGSGFVDDGFVDAANTHGTGFFRDTLTDVERVRGSEFDDDITVDDGDNRVLGQAGNDIIRGLGGSDDLRGGEGNDRLFGGAGNDILRADAGVDHLFGGAGNDQLIGGAPQRLQTDYDFADYSDVSPADGGITVNLTGGAGSSLSTVNGGAEVGSDTLTNIDVVIGTDSADTYTVDGLYRNKDGSTFNEFEGGGGDDIINGNGSTRVSYRNAEAAVTVDLQADTAFSTTTLTGTVAFAADADVIAATGVLSISVNGGVAQTIDLDTIPQTIAGLNAALTSLTNVAGSINGSNFVEITFLNATDSIAINAGSSVGMTDGTTFANITPTGIAAFAADADVIAATGVLSISVNGGAAQTIDLDTIPQTIAGLSAALAGLTNVAGSINGSNFVEIAFLNATDSIAINVGSSVGMTDGTYAGDLANIGTDTLSGVNNIRGSNFNDTLTGRDESVPGANDAGDSIRGQAGDDTIDGGTGGGDQADYRNSPNGIFADLSGGAIGAGLVQDGFGGTDTLIGIERVRGSEFSDIIIMDAGDNRVRGRDGDDVISGEDGNDDLRGGAGNDLIDGGFGDDTLDGGFGDDTLLGDAGNDTFIGAANVNTPAGLLAFTESSGLGDDVLIGDDGIDIVDYSAATTDINVNLAISNVNVNPGVISTVGIASGSQIGLDTLIEIENVTGGSGNDTIFGNAADNVLTGGLGSNLLRGGAGDDTLIGASFTTSFDDFNKVDYRDALDSITIELRDGLDSTTSKAFSTPGFTANIGTDTLVNAEFAFGSDFGDFVTIEASFSQRFGSFFEFEGRGGDDSFMATGSGRVGYATALDSVTVDLDDGKAFSTTTLTGTVAFAADADVIAATGVLSISVNGGVAQTIDLDTIPQTIAGLNAALTSLTNVAGSINGSNFVEITFLNATDSIAINAGSSVGMTDGTTFANITPTGIAAFAADADVIAATGVLSISVNGGAAQTIDLDTIPQTIAGLSAALAGLTNVAGSINGSNFVAIAGLNATDSITINVGSSVGMTDGTYAGNSAGIGNDTFSGVFGVRGSDFDDTLLGRTGASGDQFRPRGGDDFIDGRGGLRDQIRYTATDENVIIDLGTDNQTISVMTISDGFGGTDTLIGIESIRSGRGDDQLTGDVNDNQLRGQDGNDILDGGDGSDTLAPGSGDDTLDGGIDVGGGDFDSVSYSFGIFATGGITYTGGLGVGVNGIAVGDAVVTGDASIGTDTLTRIENVRGTSFTDIFIGGDAVENFDGLDGDDIFDGGEGGDAFKPGSGDDTIDGGIDVGGDDFDLVQYSFGINATGGITYTGGLGVGVNGIAVGDAVVTGDASIGTDTLTRIEGVHGTNFADIFIGGDANENFEGFGGDDILAGGLGFDTLTGGADADTFILEPLDVADLITDYDFLEGDDIDLTALFTADLTSGNPDIDSLADFVQIVQNGTDADLFVDTDGDAAGQTFQKVATLTGLQVDDTVSITFDDNGATTTEALAVI